MRCAFQVPALGAMLCQGTRLKPKHEAQAQRQPEFDSQGLGIRPQMRSSAQSELALTTAARDRAEEQKY